MLTPGLYSGLALFSLIGLAYGAPNMYTLGVFVWLVANVIGCILMEPFHDRVFLALPKLAMRVCGSGESLNVPAGYIVFGVQELAFVAFARVLYYTINS